MVTGKVLRWKPRNGTGVIQADDDDRLIWFHLSSARDGLGITTIAEGVEVDVDVEPIPQGEYPCRARAVYPHAS